MSYTFSFALHAFLVLVFLSFLFLSVVVRTEKQVFKTQITNFVESHLPQQLEKVDNSGLLAESMSRLPLEKMKSVYSNETRETQTYNKWLVGVMVGVNLILFLAIGAYLITHRADHLISKDVLVETALVLVGVGIFEYAFFRLIISKYAPLSPSLIEDRIVSDLSK